MAASGSAQVKRGYYLDYISAFDLWHLFAAARKCGREQWWQPDDLTEATLAQLPVLEKAALHASAAADTLTERPEKLFPVTTSGSTGTPLQVFRNSHDQAEVSALWARIFKAYGHRFRDSQFNIRSPALPRSTSTSTCFDV
jgi:phenylacetate-coenzyme A ligase PaaK-like adenylate-forming protein